MNRALLPTTGFKRDLSRWQKPSPGSEAGIEAVLERLSADAADPALKSHKLRGQLAGCSACSAGYDWRIVYKIVERDGVEVILLLALGTHDDVYA